MVSSSSGPKTSGSCPRYRYAPSGLGVEDHDLQHTGGQISRDLAKISRHESPDDRTSMTSSGTSGP